MKELIYTAHKVVASASFVHGGATKTFTYNYPAGTNLLASLACPSNLTIEHAYEAGRDLLAGITIRRGASTDVVLRNYTYDTLGRPFTRSTSRNGTTQSDNFGYNSRSELTSATLRDDSYAYAFDHIGNRNTASEAGTQSAYSTNNLNQYTEISLGETETSPLQYDADGNATQMETSTGTWQITYNGENRPVRFENTETQTVVECAYDSQGRRFEKKVTVAGATTLHHRYIYRGYLQIAALDLTRSAHPALWLVTWDPSQPTATRPLAIQKDGTWFTYGYDLTKNICEVFGPASYIRTAYAYAPFGAVTASGDVTQPFQWSSEVYDSELDLVYYNYRHYSPSLGRFLSRDPIEEQGGLNLYATAKNGLINQADVLGLWAWIWEDVEDFVVFKTWSDGVVKRNNRGRVWAETTATISVENVECKCFNDDGIIKWKFSSADVKLTIRVYLYRDDYYRARGGDPLLVRRYELDHVADYQKWSESEGDDIVESFSHTRSDKAGCLFSSEQKLLNRLASSLSEAREETVNKWDNSGKHDIKIP